MQLDVNSGTVVVCSLWEGSHIAHYYYNNKIISILKLKITFRAKSIISNAHKNG